LKYLLLIYEDESIAGTMTEEAQRAMFTAYGAYTAELKAAGVMLGGEALTPSTTATTVRLRGGRATTTDGPFAETKEQLGGFYYIDVPDLDAALAWAAKIPSAAWGSVEVRPVLAFG